MDPIFERTSIRKFQDRAVEQNKVEKLLRAAMSAPSAGGQQEWEFIVVTDQRYLEELSKVSLPLNPPEGQSELPLRCPSSLVKDAPLAIVVLGNTKRMRFPENWEQDLGAATENLLLEAVALDLGAVWLGVAPLKHRMDAIIKLFNLPENIKPYAMIAIGYPAENKQQQDHYHPEWIHYDGYLPVI